jgi:hypothetical protein
MLVNASNHIIIKIANVYTYDTHNYIISDKIKFVIYVQKVVFVVPKDVENATLEHLEAIKRALVFFLWYKKIRNAYTNVYFLIFRLTIHANV